LFLSSLFIFISTTTPAIYASLVAQPPPPCPCTLIVHAFYIHAFISMLIFTPIVAEESEPFYFGVMKRLKCRTKAF
jgi:hypothetical protein